MNGRLFADSARSIFSSVPDAILAMICLNVDFELSIIELDEDAAAFADMMLPAAFADAPAFTAALAA